MSEFYKSSLTKLTPQQPQQAPVTFNLTQKLPDVSAILNSCDEMIKIASHTREKAKMLQKQMGDLTRAIPMRAATARRPMSVAAAAPSLLAPPPLYPDSHQIQVTTAPKEILSSCSSTSLSSNEHHHHRVVETMPSTKLKGITTINPVMTAVMTPAKRIGGGKLPRKSDTNAKYVQKTAQQRRVNNVLPPVVAKRATPKTPVNGDQKQKGRALPNLLPPFKKNSATNSAGSQLRVTTSSKAGGMVGSTNSAIVSPRLVRTGRD